MYKPHVICPYCGTTIEAKVSGTTLDGLAHGYQPACSCAESQRAWELEHRARIEARKRAKRGK